MGSSPSVLPLTARHRIVLVGDSPDEQEMYGIWLRTTGCEVRHVENAGDAYRLIADFQPDAVITDVKLLGREDGLSLTRRLKADVRTRNVPVIVLSGFVFKTDDEAAQLAGCDVVLHKPCLPQALTDALTVLLDVR